MQNPTICWDIRASRTTHRAVRRDVYDSDNVTGADNQQERLGSAESANWFLAGFIEGEGALCVSVKKHPTCRSGFYVDPEFFLYQHESGRRILELAQQTFESGRIYPKPGNPNVLVYEISSTRALREKVIPFFERYIVPFSCKRETFERFREIPRGDGARRAPRASRPGRDREEGLRDESSVERQSALTTARRSACENPQRPSVGHPCLGMKRWSSPHGDVGDNCLR